MSSFVLEASFDTANTILGALSYQPNANYNFDWTSPTSTAPCVHPGQSPEAIIVAAIASVDATPDIYAALTTTCAGNRDFYQATALVSIPVSIVAVNNPATLAVPETLAVPAASCLPLSITATDIDADEDPSGHGILTVSAHLPPASAWTIAFTRASLVQLQVTVVASAVVAQSPANTIATSITIQSSVMGLNAWLASATLCASSDATNTVLELTVDDHGNCGATTGTVQAYSVPVTIVQMSTVEAFPFALTSATAMLTMDDPTTALPLNFLATAATTDSIVATVSSQFGFLGVPTGTGVSVGTDSFATRITITSDAFVTKQEVRVAAGFEKEVQLITTRADASASITEAVVLVSFTYLDTTSSTIVDLTAAEGSASAVAAALQSGLTNAGAIDVTRSPADAQGGFTWSVTFATLSGTTIPLLQVTVESFPAPWSGQGSAVSVARRTAGTMAPPVLSVIIPDATVAAGTFQLEVTTDACAAATVFTTAPLPYDALATDVQTALQQGFVDIVLVTATAVPRQWLITFATNTYTDCANGVRIVPRFSEGRGNNLCFACAPGIPSMIVTTVAAGSIGVLPTDTWWFTSVGRSLPPTLPVTVTPYAMALALESLARDVHVSTTACDVPELACTWVLTYTGVELQPKLGPTSGTLLLASKVLSQERVRLRGFWSLETDRGTTTTVAVGATDVSVSHALRQLLEDDTAAATTVARTPYDVTWSLNFASASSIRVSANASLHLSATMTPVTAVVTPVPGQEHHLLLRMMKSPILNNLIEQQALVCNAASGTFTVSFRGATSAPIAATSTPAQLTQLLQAMPTLPNVYIPGSAASVCSGLPVDVWLSTPSIVQLTIGTDVVPAVQSLQLTMPLPVTSIAKTTAFIQWQFAEATQLAPLLLAANASTAFALELQTQLAALPAMGTVVVTPTSWAAGIYTWQVTYTSLHGAVPLLQVLNSSLPGSTVTVSTVQTGNRQNAQFTVMARSDRVPYMGTFRLRLAAGEVFATSMQLRLQATALDVKVALEALGVGILAVTATAVSSTETQWQVTFMTSAAPWTMEVLWNDGRAVTTCDDCVAPTYPYTRTLDPQLQVTQVATPDVAFGGTFSVAYDGRATSQIPLDATTALESALNALLDGVQRVGVFRVATTANSAKWRLTFHSLDPMPELTIVKDALTGTRVESSFEAVQAAIAGSTGNVPRITTSTQGMVFANPLVAKLAFETTVNGSRVVAEPFQAVQLCSVCSWAPAQQTLSVSGTSALSGALRVTLRGVSVLVPLSATQNQVLLLLNTIGRVTSVTTSNALGLSYQCVVTFDGSMGVVPPVDLSASAVSGANVQVSVAVGNPGNQVGGTFAVSTGNQNSGPVAADASAVAMQTALRSLLGQATTVTRSANGNVPNGYCWTVTFFPEVSTAIDAVRGCTSPLTRACGLTGADADIVVYDIQELHAPDAFYFESDGATSPAVPVDASAAAVQTSLRVLPSFGGATVVKAKTTTETHWYVSGYSAPSSLRVVGQRLTTSAATLYAFHTSPLRLRGTGPLVADSLQRLHYQPNTAMYNYRIDTVNASVATVSALANIGVPPVTTGQLVATSLPPVLPMWGNSIPMPPLDLRNVAKDTLGAPPRDVPTGGAVTIEVLVTPGLQLDLPHRTNALSWTSTGSLEDVADAAAAVNLIRSSAPATMYDVEGGVLQVVATAVENPPVVLSVAAPQGVVSGTVALAFDVNGFVDPQWCQPASKCRCTTDAIGYPFVASAVQTTLAAMSARCSQTPAQNVQTLRVRFPVPVQQATLSMGSFSLAYEGSTTTPFSGQTSASAVQAALLALPTMLAMVGKVTVTIEVIDDFTQAYAVTFDPTLSSVAPLKVAKSSWQDSAATLQFTWFPQQALQLHFDTTVACTPATCIIQFLRDLPLVTVAANLLTTTVGVPPTVSVTGGWAALLNFTAPAFELGGIRFPLATASEAMETALRTALQRHVVVTRRPVVAPMLAVWQITYSAIGGALAFADLGVPGIVLSLHVVNSGENVPCSRLTITATSSENSVQLSTIIRLEAMPPLLPPPRRPAKPSRPALVCYILHPNSSLAAVPGQALLLAPGVALVSNVADETTVVVNITLSAAHGTLWIDTPYANHVQYVEGTPAGDSALKLRAKIANFRAAISSLTYKAPDDFVGNDTVSLSINGNASSTVRIEVPFTPAPPRLDLQRSSFRILEDTELVLSGITVAPAPFTPASCLPATFNLTFAVLHGLLSLPGTSKRPYLTVLASVHDITETLASITYRPSLNFAGVDSLAITVAQLPCMSPMEAAEASVEVPILVEPVPDPIALSVAAAVSTGKAQGGSPWRLPAVHISAVDTTPLEPLAFVRVQIAVDTGSVAFAMGGGLYDPANIYCRVDVANELLAALDYNAVSIGEGVAAIVVTVADSTGATASTKMAVPYVNVLPQLQLLWTAGAVREDTSLSLAAATAVGSKNVTIDVRAGVGLVRLSRGSNAWVKVLTMPGRDIDDLQYQPPPNFHGADKVVFQVGGATATMTLPIVVRAVNDLPALVGTMNATTSGKSLRLCGFSIDDADGDEYPGNSYTVSLSSTGGVFASAMAPGIRASSSAAGGLDLEGTLENLNAMIATCAIEYRPALPSSLVVVCVVEVEGPGAAPTSPNCMEAQVRYTPPPPSPPRLMVLYTEVVVEEDGLVNLAPNFAVEDADDAAGPAALSFNATLGTVDLSAIVPSTCVSVVDTRLIGLPTCLATVLAVQPVIYRPFANANGAAVITASLASSSVSLAIWIESVNDPPTWRVEAESAVWHVLDDDDTTHALASFGKVTLADENDSATTLVRVSLSVDHGALGYLLVPGTSLAGTDPSVRSSVTVDGPVPQVNEFLSQITYDPSQSAVVSDKLHLTVVDGTIIVSTAVPIEIECHPRIEVASLPRQLTVSAGETVVLPPIPIALACGSFEQPWTMEISVAVGTLQLPSADAVAFISRTLRLSELIPSLATLVYVASGTPAADKLTLRLYRENATLLPATMDIRVVAVYTGPELLCDATLHVVDDGTGVTVASLVRLAGGSDGAYEASVTSSAAVQLRLNPTAASVSASTFAWTQHLRLRGPVASLQDALKAIQVQANSTSAASENGELRFVLRELLKGASTICSVSVSVSPLNNAPSIKPVSPCGAFVNDVDTATKAWSSLFQYTVATAVAGGFGFRASFPPTIRILNESTIWPGAWSAFSFEAPLAQANVLLGAVVLNATRGIVEFIVNDRGHGTLLLPQVAQRQVTCRGLASTVAPPVTLTAPAQTCTAGTASCALQGVTVATSASAVGPPVQVSATTVAVFQPAIQMIRTTVTEHQHQVFDVSVTTAGVGSISLRVSWRSAGGIVGQSTVFVDAFAVASMVEEISGGGAGTGVGASMQSQVQQALPAGAPVTVSATYSPNSRQHWKIAFVVRAGELWTFDMALVSASPGLSVEVWPSTLLSMVSGSFQLQFQGVSTPALAASATALDVQTALELLPLLDTVAVSRSPLPDVDGGFAWTVTFYDASFNVPLLQVNTSGLHPQVEYLLGAGDRPVGSTATAIVTSLAQGFGASDVYHVTLSALHVNAVVQIAISSSAPLITGGFTLGLTFADGAVATSGRIQFNAVATVADEGVDTSLGGRTGESLQRHLATLLPGVATAIVRSGPSINQGYTWLVTFLNAPADLPHLTVISADGGLTVANVAVTTVVAANALGGTFTLSYRGETTPAMAFDSAASDVEAALMQLSAIASPNFGKVGVRVSAVDLQLGRSFAIVFLERWHGPIFAGDVAPILVDGTHLTGLGAAAVVRANAAASHGALQLASVALDHSSAASFQQRHAGMDLLVQGVPRALNAVLPHLVYLPTPTWFGLLRVQWSTSNLADNHWHSDAPMAIAVQPPAVDASTFDLGPFHVLEDLPEALTSLVFTTPMVAYTVVSLNIATAVGMLVYKGEPPATSVKIRTSVALVADVLAQVVYKGPPHFNGIDELRVAMEGLPMQTFRFRVHPVVDPPFLHINGSIEGTIDTNALPPARAAMNESGAFALTGIWIEDHDAKQRPWTLRVSVDIGTVACDTPTNALVVMTTPMRLELQATASGLNGALSHVIYTPPAGFTGEATLTLWVADAVDHVEHVRLLQVAVVPVPSLPQLRVNASLYTAREDISLPLAGIQFDGADTSPAHFAGSQVSTLFGSLVVRPDADSGVWGSGDDWRYYSVTGSVANPQWFATLGGLLYFAADDPVAGRELFASDGTRAWRVADLFPGYLGSSPASLAAFNGRLYFGADGVDTSWQLPVTTFGCNAQRSSSAFLDIVFVVSASGIWQPQRQYDCPLGHSWMTTAEATSMFNGSLDATDYVYWNECGWQGYSFQGTARKYFRFADSATTGAMKHAGRRSDYVVEYMSTTTAFAGIVCRKQRTLSGGPPRHLWQSDGTTTSKFNTSFVNPRSLAAIGSSFLFFEATTVSTGAELYRTDGTYTYGQDLNPGTPSSYPSGFVQFAGQVYFVATTSGVGRELWTTSITGGNPWATDVAADVQLGAGSSSPAELTVSGAVLYFSADDGVHGRELWSFSGGSASLVKDLFPGVTGSDPQYLTAFQSKLYFQATGSVATGAELYVSDGTAAGTTLLVDILVGVQSSRPSYLNVQSQVRNGVTQTTLIFCVSPVPTTCTWYGTDGTGAGTKPLWSATAGLAIDPALFQVATYRATMFFPLRKDTPAAVRAAPASLQTIELNINVSVGGLSLSPLVSLPALQFSRGAVGAVNQSMWVLRGSVTDLNAALAHMLFRPPLNWNSAGRSTGLSRLQDMTPVVTVAFFWHDMTTGLADDAVASIYVQPVADPPVVRFAQSIYLPVSHTSDNLSPLLESVPPLVLDEDASVAVTGLSVRAVDCLGVKDVYIDECVIDVTLSVALGSLSMPAANGVTWLRDAPTTWRLLGSVPAVNDALDRVTYEGNRNAYGTDALVVTVAQQAPGGVSGAESRATVPIRINPINDVPYMALATDYFEATEDNALLLTGVVAVDDDDDVVTVTIAVAVGVVSVGRTATIVVGTGMDDRTMALRGTLRRVNAALATLIYAPAREWNSAVGDGYDNINLTIADSGGLSSSWGVDIYVTPAPDPIVVSEPTAAFGTTTPVPEGAAQLATMEDTAMVIANLQLSCVDARPSSVLTVTLRVGHGAVSVASAIGVMQTSVASGVLQLKGTYVRVNVALATLMYTPQPLYNGADQLSVAATAYDEEMAGTVSLAGQRAFALSVLAVNNAPVWSTSEQTVVLDKSVLQQAIAVQGMSFEDPDAGAHLLELTVDAKLGFVSLNPQAEVSFILGAGDRTKYAVVQGTQQQLNLALAALRFDLDLGAFNGASISVVTAAQPRVTLTIDDLGSTGYGGPNVVAAHVYIRVTSVQNQPPVISLPMTSLVVAEDTPFDLVGLSIADPDLLDTFGAMLRVNCSCEHGSVVLRGPRTGLHVLEETAGVLVFQGAIEFVNLALAASAYVGARDWFGQDAITVTADDLGNTGTGGPQRVVATIAVSVTPVCDPPAWANATALPETFITTEDTPLLIDSLRVVDPEATAKGLARLVSLAVAIDFGGVMLATHSGLHVSAAATNAGVGPLYYSSATILGTAADISAALSGFIYMPPADWTAHQSGRLAYDRITLSLESTACSGAQTTITNVLLVDVTPVADPPVVRQPRWLAPTASNARVPLDALEDAVVALGPVVVIDVDSPTLRVSLKCSSGIVALGEVPPTLWVLQGNLSGSPSAVFQGTVADVNAALATVSFTPAPHFVGSSTVELNVSDDVLSTAMAFVVTTTAVEDSVQIFVPEEPPVAVLNRTTRLGNVFLPTAITALHLPPPPFTLFESLMVQPDKKAGATDFSTQWRSQRSSALPEAPTHFTMFQNRVIFQATTPDAGTELMQSSNGVASLLVDVWPGPESSDPAEMVVFSIDSRVYFSADGIDTSWRLPSSHADACGGFRQSSVAPNVAFVVAAATTWDPEAVYDCPLGYQWATTAQAQRIFVGMQGANGSLTEPLTYFDECGWDGFMWGGATRACFRFADSATTGACKHAGQRDSFRTQVDFATTAFAGVVCVAQEPTVTRGRELWRTDGVVTSRVADILPGSRGSNPQFLTEFAGALYFQADTLALGRELWLFDGTTARLVVDLALGSPSASPRHLTVHGSALFFAADSDVFGAELWRFDGTDAFLVSDICTGACGAEPQAFASLPAWLLFQASDGVHGTELWRTDGATTAMVADIYPGAMSSTPTGLTVFNGRVYFAATDGVHGVELWVSDGNSATQLVDLVAGATGSQPQYFTVATPGSRNGAAVAPALYFAATAVDGTCGLYATDGSPTGTVWLTAPIVVDDAALRAMPRPAFGQAQGKLFYPGRDPQLSWATVWNGLSPLEPLGRPQSIYLVDVDHTGGIVRLDVGATLGTVAIDASATSVAFLRGEAGVAASQLTLQGTVAALNEALRNVLYTAPAAAAGNDLVTVKAARLGSWAAPSTASLSVRLVPS
ncbi:hypothetical protein ACHHYP_16742 [Achlya hypogyna]|uniref:Uncharacterized protein n=1 Tax=Achlya hypogyna TaxID=1202772 RepID=A0A1V9Y5X4_ACHHY|nr:hypothetical protein ACHHYP_16742 [Achlya hypogyna]